MQWPWRRTTAILARPRAQFAQSDRSSRSPPPQWYESAVHVFRARLDGWMWRTFAACAGAWLCVMEDAFVVRAFGAIVAAASIATLVTMARRRLVIDDDRLTLHGALIRVSIRWRDVARYRSERYDTTTFAIPGIAWWGRASTRVIVEATDGRSIVVGDMVRDGRRATELVMARVEHELGEGHHERVPAARVHTPR